MQGHKHSEPEAKLRGRKQKTVGLGFYGHEIRLIAQPFRVVAARKSDITSKL